MVTWTPSLVTKLKKLYPNTNTRQLAEILGLPYSAVKAYASNHSLHKAADFNRMDVRKLDPKKVALIRDNYDSYTNHDLAKIVGCSESTVQKVRKALGLRKKNAGCFKKGHRPANSRKKQPGFGPGNMKKTQFKKGHLPANTLEDGAITIRKDHPKDRAGRPYKWIRISVGKWVHYHRWVWEQAHGPVPKGMVIIFKDGNTMNCKLKNLKMITYRENMDRNRNERCGNAARDLTDNYIAGKLAGGNKKLRKAIIAGSPELIELKRAQLKLKKTINERDNATRKTNR